MDSSVMKKFRITINSSGRTCVPRRYNVSTLKWSNFVKSSPYGSCMQSAINSLSRRCTSFILHLRIRYKFNNSSRILVEFVIKSLKYYPRSCTCPCPYLLFITTTTRTNSSLTRYVSDWMYFKYKKYITHNFC